MPLLGTRRIHSSGVDVCNIFKMYSNELSNKLWFLCRKIFYDSPFIGFNSLNVNTRRYYATLSNNKHKINDLQIDPWFITGFSDGEGCFSCSVLKSSSYKFGWEVQPIFQIKLHIRDYPLLLRIQHSLGGIGTVSSNQSSCAFRVKKLSELIEFILFFFDKYPSFFLVI